MDVAFEEAPEELVDSDDAADDYKHAKLLQAIGNLDGKKKQAEIQRTEPAAKAAGFQLAPGSGKVDISDLLGAVHKGSNAGDVKKQLNRVQAKQKLLNTPLPKNELEKIQRNLAYESTTVEVTRWDPIVTKNRKAEQLEFPLLRPAVQLRTTKQMAKGHKPRTPLEIEVAKLLAGSKNVATVNKELTEAEERALQAMSVEEAKERRAELQKYRALLSYKEAKARRQKKIKSKKFHRILRKEKEKKEKQQLDELQQKDPEAYADVLLKLQKDRIEERMSLKHRGGSKFMERQKIYGKFNEKARQSIADMLEKSKELREKVDRESESSDDEDEAVKADSDVDNNATEARFAPSGIPVVATSANPWMAAVKPQTQHSRPEAMVNQFKKLDEAESEEDDKEMENGKEEDGEMKNVEEEGKEEKKQKEVSEEEDSEKDIEQSQKKEKQARIAGMGIDDIFLDAQVKMKKSAEEQQAKKAAAVKDKREKRKAQKDAQKKKQMKKTSRKRRKDESSSSESESESDSETEELVLRKAKDKDESAELEIDPNEQGLGASLKRRQTMEDFEGTWSGDEDNQESRSGAAPGSSSNAKPGLQQKAKGNDPQVDPKKYLTVTSRLDASQGPTLIEGDGEEMEDADNQQRMTIAEAFAQDDVVAEFKADKMAAIEKDKPKDIDLTLPGWGTWGGTGLVVSKKKRKRFIIKAPPAGPRKDKDLKGVIISETKDNTISKHQVKNIPFPFTSVNQFEASVRAPIGKTWNPENAYRKLIQPKVVSKMGTVIEPIDKAQVFKKQSKQLPESEKQEDSKMKFKKGGHQQKKKKKKN